MPEVDRPFRLATRGSALALAQANTVLAQCRAAFPRRAFELAVIKTTGDKLQTASLARPDESLPKGLFTKELEVALLNGEADLAVHSLKDLPTDLPTGLALGAVSKRADVRDVLLYRAAPAPVKRSIDWTPGQREPRGFKPKLAITGLPSGATVATSSTRRRAQLLMHRPDLEVVEIRGNVATRLQKLATQPQLDATILAAAGLQRLHFQIRPGGQLELVPAARRAGEPSPVPDGLLATVLEPEVMLPCVGQGAVGLEIRAGDARGTEVCAALDHFNTRQCVTAERAFLQTMGGGCQSPVAAYAVILGHQIWLRAVSFRDGSPRRAEGKRAVREAAALGAELARQLL